MTLNSVGLTQFTVIRIIHRNIGLKCFFIYLIFLSLSLVFAYIYISQRCVKTHLSCGEIYYKHNIANCQQNVPVEKFWESAKNWQKYKQKYNATFLWPTVYIQFIGLHALSISRKQTTKRHTFVFRKCHNCLCL